MTKSALEERAIEWLKLGHTTRCEHAPVLVAMIDRLSSERDEMVERCAAVAEEVMVCRTKVNRDGSIVEQCRTPTAKEIAKAIRSLLSKPQEGGEG